MIDTGNRIKRAAAVAFTVVFMQSTATYSYAGELTIEGPKSSSTMEIMDSLYRNKDRLLQNIIPEREFQMTEKEAAVIEEPAPVSEEITVPKNPNSAIPAAATENASNTNFLILVNKSNPLPKNFAPESTINIANFVKSTKKEILLEETAANQYISMVQAMGEDGLNNLAAVSGHRSYDYQSSLYQRQISLYTGSMGYDAAARRAGRVVAPPGTSEHQTGLAIDVSSSSVSYNLSESFESTKEFEWLRDNCHNFGFIIRYQKEKSDLTDIIYEPWHLRYVGPEAAEAIYSSSQCLEEYLGN